MDVCLHTIDPPRDAERFHFCTITYPRVKFLNRLYISPRMQKGLREAARKCDILHNHGLWMMPNIYAGEAAAAAGCLFFNSPRGTLSAAALERSRPQKKLMWHLMQSKVVRQSFCIHATSESEFEHIRSFGINNPVAIIPNGIDISALAHTDCTHESSRKLLYLGRIHPIKGIDNLLYAWGNVCGKFDDWELHIVGPDDSGYLARMKQLSGSLNLQRVHFRGPLYGAEKSETFQESELFILPSHSENFGMSVAEALAHGLPCIVSRGAPWEGVIRHSCGWWINNDVETMTECLSKALSLSAEALRESGLRGRDWMEKEFSWKRIGAMMHKTYLWALGKENKPEWVRT